MYILVYYMNLGTRDISQKKIRLLSQIYNQKVKKQTKRKKINKYYNFGKALIVKMSNLEPKMQTNFE